VGDSWLAGGVGEILGAADTFGAGSAATPEKVQVELVSANPTGPLTVAHGRNGAYGDSVARLLEYAGHEVARECYYNDAGTQMERFLASVEAVRRGEEPPEDGYRGEYLNELAAQPGDPVSAMLARIEATLERFRVRVDTWERQSDVETEIPEAVALLDTYEEGGAVWARTSAHGDDKDRVLIRSDGAPTYFAADAAYIRRKYAKGLDRLVYVLGADHHGYVGRLQALAEMLGRRRESVEVLIYQLVHLVAAGEARKISKRRGDVVFLDDLLDAIGVDAARWYLVSRGHDQTIELDVDLARERTQKNPVYYVQYAHARVCSVLEQWGGDPAELSGADVAALVSEHETQLLASLLEYPGAVESAARDLAPHLIAFYLRELAAGFHSYYNATRLLVEEESVKRARLALAAAVRQVLRNGLALLGVSAPDRM
jgi:arginyl-tRNA synthetase